MPKTAILGCPLAQDEQLGCACQQSCLQRLAKLTSEEEMSDEDQEEEQDNDHGDDESGNER